MARSEKFSKENLLNGGIDFIKQNGFERLNARDLAQFIGCSTKPIFRNYENMQEYKQELKKYMKADYNQFIEQYIDKKN